MTRDQHSGKCHRQVAGATCICNLYMSAHLQPSFVRASQGYDILINLAKLDDPFPRFSKSDEYFTRLAKVNKYCRWFSKPPLFESTLHTSFLRWTSPRRLFPTVGLMWFPSYEARTKESISTMYVLTLPPSLPPLFFKSICGYRTLAPIFHSLGLLRVLLLYIYSLSYN